jgi:hypothetical protein
MLLQNMVPNAVLVEVDNAKTESYSGPLPLVT